MMPIENIPDWEKRIARQDAFWDNYIIDRPVVHITAGNPDYRPPESAAKSYSSIRERWMDTDYVVSSALEMVKSSVYLGDSVPQAWPNLGPEIFSAFLGCELEYSETTSWAIPNLTDWSKTDHIRFSEDNFYWRKIIELTQALLEAGKGKFYTGITDLHSGGDAIAAFRDPLNLNFDMIEAREHVVEMLKMITQTYLRVYDFFYDMLVSHDQAITSWPGIASSRKWYVPSNDFSCMISKEMFDEVFLPAIIEECAHMEASIYHLDGPNALRHLDSLLEIKQLNAIQWVYGEGNGRATNWLHIYKRCQSAGKGIQLWIEPDELDTVMQELRPEGVWLGVYVPDVQTGQAVVKAVESWT